MAHARGQPRIDRAAASVACVIALAFAFASPSAAVPPGEGSFGGMSVVPADASVAVRVRGALALRSSGAVRPAQEALLRLADSRVLGQAWDGIAAELGVPADQLVDRVLGTDAIYAERAVGDRTEWVLVARADQALQELMVARLSPANAAGGRSVFAKQQLATSWRPPYMAIGPADRTGLLDAAVRLLDAPTPEGSLAAHPDLAAARAWGMAPIEVVLRHDAPVGGLSAFAAHPTDGALRIRHRSRFDRAPLHVAPGAPADAGLLRALEPAGIAVLSMNPWRGPLDAGEPLDSLLLEGGFDEAMRGNLGARQAVVLADRALDGTPVRVPSIAIAMEVGDALLAERQWDGWGRRFAEALARRSGASVPERAPAAAGTVREAAIGPAAAAAFADHPFVRQVSLCWRTVSGPNGSWQVVASDRAILDGTVTAVLGAVRTPDLDDAHELGVLDGRALAAHLRTWALQPAMFAPDGHAPFAQAVGLLADIAVAAPSVRWRARAPGGGVIESEVQVELPRAADAAAPGTAGAASAGKGQ